MQGMLAYWGVFSAAFVAATFFPAQSELLLGALLASGKHSVILLILAASVGNTLGSCVNWALGRYLMRFQTARWFPVSQAGIAKAEAWYTRYGRWSLLLSWVPLIGDPITLAAGILREPFSSFIAIVGLAKTARYIILAAIVLQWT